MTTAPPQVPFSATLRDGRTVMIRLLEAGDNERLIALGAALPQNDWLHAENDLRSAEMVGRLVNARDAEHWRQIVAVAPDGAIVAYASARLLPARSSHVADIQLIVGEAWRRCGLGTVMAGELSLMRVNSERQKCLSIWSRNKQPGRPSSPVWDSDLKGGS